MGDLKAIQTVYKGYRFRSRLEARWAVFFDALGVKWEYEKEGYDLDGVRYLPDFWLPELHRWCEVKPGAPTEDELQKAALLGNATQQMVVILEAIPELRPPILIGQGDALIFDVWPKFKWVWTYAGRPTVSDVYWSECYVCNRLSLSTCDCQRESGFFEVVSALAEPIKEAILRNYREHAGHNYMCIDNKAKLYKAFEAARQARFEHGEQP